MAKAIAEVSIVPVGTKDPSFSSVIASCYHALEDEGLKHELTPMSTLIEGELDKVLAVVQKMHEVPFSEGAHRVVTTITIDERRDKPVSMEHAVEAVIEEARVN